MPFKERKGNREVNGFYFNKLIAQSEKGLVCIDKQSPRSGLLSIDIWD